MGASDKSAADKKMAANLKAKGIHHGKRLTSPRPNSGGTTMVRPAVGSSNYQRLMKK